jgi:iron complex transport system substrate-binding protein
VETRPETYRRFSFNPLSSDKGLFVVNLFFQEKRPMFRRSHFILIAVALLLSACAPAATSAPVPAAAPTVELTATIKIEATAAPKVEPTTTPMPTAEPITLTDGLGRKVQLAKPAQRILSIAPSNTELLYAIGAGAQMIGRDDLSDYPEDARQLTSIGSAFGKINTEAIVALNPDLVLAAEISPPEQVKTLEDLGLTVYWLANPKDFDGLYQNLETVGQLTGHTAEAQQLIDSIKARYQAVIQKIATSSLKPKIFYELDATDPTKPYTPGPGTFIDTLIDLAGGDNVGRALKDQYAQISSEELVKQNPDIILLGDAAYGISIESVKQRAGWSAIAAVKTDAIYTFDDNLVSRPGPRLIDGLETLAKLIHPELFK